MPAHLKLKERQPGQGDAAEQTEIDFKTQLLKDERDRDLKKKGFIAASLTDEHNNDESDLSTVKRLRTGIATALTIKTPFPQDADERFEDVEESEEEDEKESER